MQEYFNLIKTITEELGIPLWLFAVLFIWSLAWKLIAMWKAGKKGSVAWFMLLGMINTIGILEILYYFIFSEMKYCKFKKQKPRKKKRR